MYAGPTGLLMLQILELMQMKGGSTHNLSMNPTIGGAENDHLNLTEF